MSIIKKLRIRGTERRVYFFTSSKLDFSWGGFTNWSSWLWVQMASHAYERLRSVSVKPFSSESLARLLLSPRFEELDPVNCENSMDY